MSWTEERVSILKKLWGEGHTAAEIAKQLGGVTRNAVIGKAHRLKLSNRVSPIQQNKKPANSNKSVERKVQTEKAKAQTSSVQQAVARKSAPSSIVEEKPIRAGDLYSLMDLQPRMCRWPSGDPKEEGFGFCGCKTMPGLPYCEEHAKMAYQAATRNRIFSSDKVAASQAVSNADEKRKAVAG
ncbi:MAG: GcrA family cell cycle regulator [Alphaproteobacteria bacterium]